MQQSYTELIPFNPPQDLYLEPTHSSVQRVFGIDSGLQPIDLALAQVMLVAQKESKSWFVGALNAINPEIDTSFGGIRIDNEAISGRQSLDVANKWVRTRENTLWVPGRSTILELDVDDEAVSARGVMLVRCLGYPRHTIVGSSEPVPSRRRGRFLGKLPFSRS